MRRYDLRHIVEHPFTLFFAQDGAEPSAVSITLSNLQRLAHFAEDNHAAYTEKAQSILASNGQLLKQAPHALGSMTSAALLAKMGYVQVRCESMWLESLCL